MTARDNVERVHLHCFDGAEGFYSAVLPGLAPARPQTLASEDKPAGRGFRDGDRLHAWSVARMIGDDKRALRKRRCVMAAAQRLGHTGGNRERLHRDNGRRFSQGRRVCGKRQDLAYR